MYLGVATDEGRRRNLFSSNPRTACGVASLARCRHAEMASGAHATWDLARCAACADGDHRAAGRWRGRRSELNCSSCAGATSNLLDDERERKVRLSTYETRTTWLSLAVRDGQWRRARRTRVDDRACSRSAVGGGRVSERAGSGALASENARRSRARGLRLSQPRCAPTSSNAVRSRRCAAPHARTVRWQRRSCRGQASSAAPAARATRWRRGPRACSCDPAS